ncbi:TPA: oligosaccharide flippase family protein [Streptococcus suis]
MEKIKKLAINSLLFALGNVGTTIVSVLLLPILTTYLTPSEFGIVDLILALTNILLPFVSLGLGFSIVRFSIEHRKEQNDILLTSLLLFHIVTVVIAVFSPFLNIFPSISEYYFHFLILLYCRSINTILMQYIRGIEKIKIYTVNGILQTILTAILSVLFIVYFRLGIFGYLLSNILITFFSSIYLLIYCNINLSTIKQFKGMDIRVVKSMLSYGLPLIPNDVMWWVVNYSSRFFLISSAGSISNGLYAVAVKIPTLLNLASNVFMQAWQLIAFEDVHSKKDENEINTLIFNFFSLFVFFLAFVLISLSKWLFATLFSSDYYLGNIAIPFLILGTIFSIFSSFFATSSMAIKNTKPIFLSTFLGAVLCLVLNYFLIPNFTIVGASLSSALSYFFVMIYRFWVTKKIVNYSIDCLRFILNIVILTMFAIFKLLIASYYIDIWVLILLVVVNYSIIVTFKTIILRLFKSTVDR